jgi:hypothetical protein
MRSGISVSAHVDKPHVHTRNPHSLRRSTESAEDWEMTMECAESFVFRKLQHKVYPASPDDKRQDDELSERLRSLAFVDVEHLDIKSFKEGDAKGLWGKPEEFLRQMAAEAGPSAKIRLMTRCSEEVTQVLMTAKGGEMPGADDLLPAMILCVKQANPPRLSSNLQFIQQYASPASLSGKAAYNDMLVRSAVTFLENVDATALSISAEDFEKGLKQCQEQTRMEMDRNRRSVSDPEPPAGAGYSEDADTHG